ncbi:MAG: NAD(P)/FAD-dependent oxidoreductase [Deltaproteobacteria bacterium]|nr:NAD(P)/FAD-dependent oxidoreductase [Deltaproteobacteria bacterium]
MKDTFDAIIIGGGHNGQILGGYLTKAGLETLVLERRMEPGGGLCTEEVTIPGFWHNLHAYFLRWLPDLPFYKDLELERYGIKVKMPPVQTVVPFSDGRCLVFHMDEGKTIKNISYFSRKDAQTYKDLLGRFRAINEKIITPEGYSPPLPSQEKKALLEKSELGREYLAISKKSPLELAKEFFESEQMRAMVIFVVTTRMFLADEPGLGYHFIQALNGSVRGSFCMGGSHYLAHGTCKFLEAHGGRLWEASHVREIIVEGGRATGVILDDGRRIHARRLVVSSVDIPQTFLELVGEDKLEPHIVQRAKNFKFSRFVLFSAHLALNEPLHYTSTPFNPDINAGFNYNIGLESTEDFLGHVREINEGIPPKKPGMQCAVPTLHDPTQAPPGKHAAFLWQFAPYHLRDGGPQAWDRIKAEYMEVCLERWRQYAPNLNTSNIIAKYAFSPLDVERKLINMCYGDHCVGRASQDQMLENRPFPGLKPYRTPIEGLYLCGSGSHPFGNITGAPGYNAANVICEDLELKKWWNPPDLRELWSKLQ